MITEIFRKHLKVVLFSEVALSSEFWFVAKFVPATSCVFIWTRSFEEQSKNVKKVECSERIFEGLALSQIPTHPKRNIHFRNSSIVEFRFFFGRGRCPGVGLPDQQPSECDRDNPIPSELGSPEKFFRPPAVRNLRIEPLQLGRDDDDDAAHNERTKPGVEI